VDGAAIAVGRRARAGAAGEIAALVAARHVCSLNARISADCFGALGRAEHHKS
jgi:hypothetical protein